MIEFFSCENQDKLYNYCMSKGTGYTREEFDEFIEETILKVNPTIGDKEINQNSLSDGGAKASFGKNIRRAFTKVLAVSLAVFSAAPMAQNFVPRAEAAKVSRSTGKENSKRNRKNNNKTIVKNDTAVKDNDYINQKNNYARIYKSRASTKKFKINSNLIKLAALVGVVGIGGTIIYGAKPENDAYDRQSSPKNRISRTKQYLENFAITVNVSFRTSEGDELLCDGKKQVEFKFNIDDMNQPIYRTMSKRLDLSGCIGQVEFNNLEVGYEKPAQKLDGGNIEVVIFDYHEHPQFSCEAELLKKRKRQQRDAETSDEKNERKKARYELKKNEESEERENFQVIREAFENKILINLDQNDKEFKGIIEEINEGPEWLKARIGEINQNLGWWKELQRNNSLLTESLLNEIIFRCYSDFLECFPEYRRLKLKALIEVYAFSIDRFIDFFSRIKNLNISNLKEFFSRSDCVVGPNLDRMIKNSHYKEIALFRNSFSAFMLVGHKLKTNNPISDLKFNLTSLQRIKNDFENINKDKFLKDFSAPIIEAVDRIIKELKTILLSRNEAEKEEEIPTENSSSQFIKVSDNKNRYVPLGGVEPKLGSGTNGTVCLYLDTQTGKKVAIKTNRIASGVIILGAHKDFSSKQFEELSKVKSPHVAGIIGRIPRVIDGKGTADVVMECIEDGIPLKHFVYNLTDNREATILRLCVELVRGAIALSGHGVCELDFDHTQNLLIDKSGKLKYIDYDDREIRTPKEAEKSNFNRVKNMVFDILKCNFPTTLYKELIKKMGYILKVKEDRVYLLFHVTEGVRYNPKDVIEVPSSLSALLDKIKELQSENRSVIQKTQ